MSILGKRAILGLYVSSDVLEEDDKMLVLAVIDAFKDGEPVQLVGLPCEQNRFYSIFYHLFVMAVSNRFFLVRGTARPPSTHASLKITLRSQKKSKFYEFFINQQNCPE